MIKLIALYRKPDDVEAFERHYFEVHAPLASKMPGLRRMEVARITGSPAGKSDYHLVAELYFDDRAAGDAAMASPEGRAAGKDLMGFAGKWVHLMWAEVRA